MIEFNYNKLPYERYHTRRWASNSKCRSMPHLNRAASDLCLFTTYLVEGFADFFEANALADGEPIDIMTAFEDAVVALAYKLDDEYVHSKMQIAENANLTSLPEHEVCIVENIPKIAEQWFFGHLDVRSPKDNDVQLLSYLASTIRRAAIQN